MYDEKPQEEYVDMPERASSQLPLSNQEKAITELHDTIAELTERLKPVLTPGTLTDKTVADRGDEPKDVRSPLAAQLSSNNTGISVASRKIRTLMGRLEC